MEKDYTKVVVANVRITRVKGHSMIFPDEFKSAFQQNGLFSVKSLFDLETVNLLGELTDQLMLGERKLEGMFFQLDPNSPEYSAVNFDVNSSSTDD